MAYQFPVRDVHYLLNHAADFDAVRETGAFEDLSDDFVGAILEEAGKFANDILAPLNWTSDQQGARLENGKVFTTPGFKEAYAQYVEAGWNSVAFPEEWGGQNMPNSVALSVVDAMQGACISFAMGTMLTTAAVKALLAFGDDEQKRLYLEKLVTAEWSGTMNLSEPQAGSDLATIKTKATPNGDGTYNIKGQKIWISYGDHDMSDNIVHLVLARLPDAPEGTRGISMFLVPKFRVDSEGNIGQQNDVKIVSIEEKLGQHGSPTCVMAYGDNDECIGTLVGKENEGLRNMFVMMNAARIDVGMQAASVGEAAFQKSLEYAQDRPQGREFGVKSGPATAIWNHPDVRRNLYTMKALTDASKAICLANMVAYDVARRSPDPEIAAKAKEREELLTPLSKAFSSDRALETTNIGIQIHGGMGFVEETGAAQFFRDVRICTIYEGTNGIQGIDLIGRKLGMGEGKLAYDLIEEMIENADAAIATGDADLARAGERMKLEAESLRENTAWMVTAMQTKPEAGLAGGTPFLEQFGYVAGGHYLLKAAIASHGAKAADASQADYHDSRMHIASFYCDNLLPRAQGFAPAVRAGAETVEPLEPTLLSA
ncbi:acyl-CoA dehydrogenase [Parvularcula sp. ZS-1/3]|uniref:3-methylmercaptopropionyl-CoA dehydrogenase n=1 Tax=Parvularcula mediterranea TaxID=2732508 RepID=A0A7Y3W4H4_9PROT|nr:acyl-CoA dehydrogenase [Parvularcula mediterranea]NNU15277.1 acyl-CoA dehydrogenase [Parvularcula mediterranea]